MPKLLRVSSEHEDVMHDIEAVVIDFDANHADVSDHTISRVYEALFRQYKAELRGSASLAIRLPELDQTLYDEVRSVADWWLGRSIIDEDRPVNPTPKTVADMVDVFQVLANSVKFWSKDGGRRGYLEYVSPYV